MRERGYAKAELASPQSYNFGESWNTVLGEEDRESRGEVTFIEGDFFQRDWEVGIYFDLTYDYTVSFISFLEIGIIAAMCLLTGSAQFLCALHPMTHPQLACRMADFLAPTRVLVCLEFPMYKDPKLPGPPWDLNGVHWNLLADGGDGSVSDEGDSGSKDQERGQFRRILYERPARSYGNGKGTDMLSVYVKRL